MNGDGIFVARWAVLPLECPKADLKNLFIVGVKALRFG